MPSKSEFTKSAGKTRRVTLSTKPATVAEPEAIVNVTPLNPRLHNLDPVTGFALPRELPALVTNPEPVLTDQPGDSVSDLPDATALALLAEQRETSSPIIVASDTPRALSADDIAAAVAGLHLPNVQPVIAATTEPAAPNTANDKALAKAAAAKAVAAFYSGRSLPFKSAGELKRKSPINFALTRDATERSAALLATILTYCDVQPGTLQFVRGSGAVPGRLLGFTGSDAARIFNAGPESGGLSNCLPDRVRYISGPLAGPGAENAVFALNYNAVKANLTAFNVKTETGEHLFSAALGLLDLLHNAPAAS